MTGPVSVDPIAVIKAALSRIRVTPESTYQPEPVEGIYEDPDPVVIPEQVSILPDPADLPAVVLSDDGLGVDLGSMVGVLWQVFHSMQIRTVYGASVITDGRVWTGGSSYDIPVPWSTAPATTPTGALPDVEADAAWAGDMIAVSVDPTTISDTGCTVRITNTRTTSVAPTSSSPVRVYAHGLYLFTPELVADPPPEP